MLLGNYTKPNPASSKWREPLSRRGIDTNNVEDKIKTTKLKDNQFLNFSQTLSLQQTQSFSEKIQYLAQGTVTPDPKKNQLQIVTINDAGDQNVVKTFPIEGPCYSMAWLDDKLLIGSNGGQLYCRNRFEYSKTTHDTSKKPLLYTHSDISNMEDEAPSPEQWSTNSKITNVSINLRDTTQFLTSANSSLYIWNFEQTKTPSFSIKASQTPICVASWNPHHSQQIISSGVSKGIKLLDLRSLRTPGMTSLKWKVANAHQGSIKSVKIHPLIPYWIASGGSDGCLKVWDIRYNGKDPLLSIEAHDRMIKHISWSNIHSEFIASGGIDRKVKIWNIKVEPHHLMSTVNVNDVVVGLDYSKNGKNHLNTLTGSGEFSTFNMTYDFMEPHISYRFKELEEREIEKNIYFRDFSSAFDKIIVMTEQTKKKDLKKALKLLDLCKTKVLSSSKINQNGKKRFKEEIQDVTYFIPQNLNTNILKEKKTKISNLMLNCQILSFIQNNSFNEISNMESQIIERIDQAAENIDIPTLKEVINIYLLNDYKRGLNFTIQIGKIYKRQGIYDKFQEISKMILSPTTFEVTTNPSLSESAFKQLTKKLEDSEYIFSQFSLLRDVICSLWEPDSASKIISIVEKKNHSGDEAEIYDILPQSVLRIYLNSILSLDKLVKFFTVANDLLMIMHKNQNQLDFQQIVKELINGIGFQKYKEIAATMPVNDLEDSVDDKDILNYLGKCKNVIISTLNISFNSIYLPQSICDIMFNILKTFSVDVETLLKKIIVSSSAVGYAKQILQAIERDPKKATINDINVVNNENEKDKDMNLKVRQKSEQLESFFDKFVKSNKDK